MPRVYNKHHKDAPADAVYVGRPSVWGNPFSITESQTRDEAVELYKRWIYAGDGRQDWLRTRIQRELKGKDLVCWCFPKRCHAEILLEIANGE